MPLSGVGTGNMSAAGLLQRQAEAIRQMLNFNSMTHGLGAASNSVRGSLGEPSWKVLVYDDAGQSILTPLFNVKDLRDAGVTLNILLHSERYCWIEIASLGISILVFKTIYYLRALGIQHLFDSF